MSLYSQALATGIAIGVFGVLAMLSSICAAAPAPVISLPPPPSERINHHIVSSDETLYAIAWRYELDVEALAVANGIVKPYHLRPGQRLTLDLPHAAEPRPVAVTPTTSPPAAPASKPMTSAAPVKPPLSPARISQTAPKPEQPIIKSAPVLVKPPPQRPTASPVIGIAPPQRTSPASTFASGGVGSWRWPVTGRFTRNYDSGRVFKGIDIQSAAGRPVTAAATGTVVYAGNGLPAYGQLIIIKHDDTYLSAYAHNRKLFVSEGVVVKSGQTISEVGGDPANPGRLYFEIRERGKPVDPLRLLPKQ